MGETVMDILFHERKDENGKAVFVPFASVPGGSSFNSMISIGRSRVPCLFVGYTGENKVGHQIADFLQENNISTEYFQIRPGERAAISLAYLNSNGDADYTFYKDEPLASQDYLIPDFTNRDYMLFGSYFAICPGLRTQVGKTLEMAHEAGTLIYYDINFRKTYQHRKEELLPVVRKNCSLSSIVRGSADDFEILFGTRDPDEIYGKHISPFCPIFMCTAGAGLVRICTPRGSFDFDVPEIPAEEIVSTVGAGDNFNAGFLCAMHSRGVRKEMLESMEKENWAALVANGIDYASQVCRSQDNYIKPMVKSV